MRRLNGLTALAVVVSLAAVGLVLRSRSDQAAKLDPARITKVTRGDLELTIDELGKITPAELVAVRSKVAGQVEKVFVDEGMRVKRGQLLLRLEPRDFQRKVVTARHDVARARAVLRLAKLLLDRREQAIKDRAVSQTDVDTSYSDYEQKRIALAQAQQALHEAQDQLRYSRIVSPMAGTVIQCNIRAGETVVPGTMATLDERPLLLIANLSTLIAKVELNQIDVARVKLGQKVTLTLDALPGRTYEAIVTRIAPTAILPKGKEVEVFPVTTTLLGADLGNVKPGMIADVKIHLETRKNVLKLRIEAIIKEKGRSYVHRVLRSDTSGKTEIQRVEIQVGVRDAREEEVVSGLAEGAEVLIKPLSSDANEVK